MRTPALQFSILAVAISPVLIQASPLPFTPQGEVVTSPRPAYDPANYGRSSIIARRVAPERRALGLGFMELGARDAAITEPSSDQNLVVGSTGSGDGSFTGVGILSSGDTADSQDCGGSSSGSPVLHAAHPSADNPPADQQNPPPSVDDPEAANPNLDASHNTPPPDDCPCRNQPAPSQDASIPPPSDQEQDPESWPQIGDIDASNPPQDGGCDDPPAASSPEAAPPPDSSQPDDVASPGGNLDAAHPSDSDGCEDMSGSPGDPASPGANGGAQPATGNDPNSTLGDGASPNPGSGAATQPGAPNGQADQPGEPNQPQAGDDSTFGGQQGSTDLGLSGGGGGGGGGADGPTGNSSPGAATDGFHPLLDILSHDNDLINIGNSTSQGSASDPSAQSASGDSALITALSDDSNLLDLDSLVIRDSYSGAGGSATGGSVSDVGGLINAFSNNGGDGGVSQSGDALSGTSSAQSNAAAGASSYSGAGGAANGGSVNGGPDHGSPLGFINIASNNGGDGGASGSGNAGSILNLSPPDTPSSSTPASDIVSTNGFNMVRSLENFRRSVLDTGLFGRQRFSQRTQPRVGTIRPKDTKIPSTIAAMGKIRRWRMSSLGRKDEPTSSMRPRGSLPMGSW